MRIMGLDIGDKRIGVALCDPDEILASPHSTIVRKTDEQAIQSIIDIALQSNVKCIVAGVPYSMDGSIGKQAAEVITFIEKISQSTEIPVEMQDERLSTVAAENLLKEAGRRRNKLKDRRDSAAAAYILQGYLDKQRFTIHDT
jgi:putative Holliday junction resolvase